MLSKALRETSAKTLLGAFLRCQQVVASCTSVQSAVSLSMSPSWTTTCLFAQTQPSSHRLVLAFLPSPRSLHHPWRLQSNLPLHTTFRHKAM